MKRRTLVVGLTLAVLAATVSVVSANIDGTTNQIARAFDDMKTMIDQAKNNKINSNSVAKVDNVEISYERFMFYKANLELTYALNGNGTVPDDKEILKNLISEDLAVQQAIDRGITVSEEEVTEAIDYQRGVYETFQPTNKEEELVLEIMKNRIRISGLTDDEFWNSEFVKEGYKKAILSGKLMIEFISNGTVEDPEGFYAYKNQLFEKSKNKIIYSSSFE